MNQFTAGRNADYLATEVMTASPPKLRLMLIEAALRHAGRARQLWTGENWEEAGEALIRCQQIVSELMAGMNPQPDSELVQRVLGVYVYVFRSLVQAHLKRDAKLLADAMAVLEVERDTWRAVCDQSAGQAAVPPPAMMDLSSFQAFSSPAGFSMHG